MDLPGASIVTPSGLLPVARAVSSMFSMMSLLMLLADSGMSGALSVMNVGMDSDLMAASLFVRENRDVRPRVVLLVGLSNWLSVSDVKVFV